MEACMNKDQQVPEDQQAAKLQWNTQRNKNMSIRHINILKFRLIHRPHCSQTTRQKHCQMTYLIPVQGKDQPNQWLHLIHNPHFWINESLIMKKYPLKTPHQGAFTSKQEIFEIIKSLHIKCGFLDNEHLFTILINWLNHREVPDMNVEIAQNLYNAYCTPKSFLLRKILKVGIPKSTVLVVVFRILLWLLSLINAGPRRVIHMQIFEIVSKKRRDHLLQARCTMEFLHHPLILQWHPRKR